MRIRPPPQPDRPHRPERPILPERPIRPERQRGAALIVASIVAFVVLVLMAGMVTMSFTKSRALAETVRQTNCEYVAHAALNAAFAEVLAGEDPEGDGLGAVGTGDPVVFTDSQGNVLGEYLAIVTQQGTNNVITAVAGVPDLANPEFVESMEGVVQAQPTFLLKPKPGAISASGPITHPSFPSMGSDDLIDGGQFPAFTLSSELAYENLMDELGFLIFARKITGEELQGTPYSVYDHHHNGKTKLPLAVQSGVTLTAEALNDYRNSLRTAVLDLAAQADRVVTSRINNSPTWGTENNPQVTVIEAKKIGKDRVFNKSNQTITGNGTLIIKHTIRPGKNGKKPNINWDGDVYVLGFDGDGSDLVYFYGADVNINGNFILLASDNTEASLEMRDYGSTISNVTVNGALLTLAEAKSHESEIEVEGDSRLTVNGIMGLYGSRIEIEASGSDTQLNVNGTLAIGMAQDLNGNINRGDDFEFEMRGEVQVIYDKNLVTQAVEGLSNLDINNYDGVDQVQSYEVKLSGGATGSASGHETWMAVQELIESGQELGFDMEASTSSN